MKRWGIKLNPEGGVEDIDPDVLQNYVGAPSTSIRRGLVWFYCDAVDELGALARYMEATKEQADETLDR